MKFVLKGMAALLLTTSIASAGGVERNNQSVGVLFKEGRYAEFSLATSEPDVSGTSVTIPMTVFNGASSGNMAGTTFNFGAAYKADLNDRWSYALIYDQPYGADVEYGGTFVPGISYFAAGATAELRSHALTGLMQYNFPTNFSVYGGLRLQSFEAEANIPFVAGYSAKGDRDIGLGYVVGAAYERPDIALRVSLTYNSEIKTEHDVVENSLALGSGRTSTTEIETPDSLHLEFQTGVAQNTLLFGGIRWVNWSDFEIRPNDYATLTGGPLVSYEDDTITYTLGVAQRLNDNWAVAVSADFEESSGAFFTNLGPTDGRTSVGVAAIYSQDNYEITAGVRYINVGDAQTRVGAVAPGANFEGNEAWAAGVKVGFTF